jgi:outer membrane protein
MKRAAAIFLAAVAVTGTAAAQGAGDDGWRVTLGAGGLYAPTYEGDDDYRLSVLPNIEVTYSDVFFASVQNGVGYRLINTPTLRAGPIGRIKFSRNEDGEQAFAVSGEDTDDLQGLGDVDTSVELGGFVEYELGTVTLSGEVRQAVSGHDGWVGDLGARWSGRGEVWGRSVSWSAGPRARFVGDAYNEAYFGVNAAQAAASGLPVYDVSGGLYSYGAGASVIAPLSSDRSWALVFVAGYDRLTGDAGDSPLVQQRGDDDQASIGLFIARRLP